MGYENYPSRCRPGWGGAESHSELIEIRIHDLLILRIPSPDVGGPLLSGLDLAERWTWESGIVASTKSLCLYHSPNFYHHNIMPCWNHLLWALAPEEQNLHLKGPPTAQDLQPKTI